MSSAHAGAKCSGREILCAICRWATAYRKPVWPTYNAEKTERQSGVNTPTHRSSVLDVWREIDGRTPTTRETACQTDVQPTFRLVDISLTDLNWIWTGRGVYRRGSGCNLHAVWFRGRNPPSRGYFSQIHGFESYVFYKPFLCTRFTSTIRRRCPKIFVRTLLQYCFVLLSSDSCKKCNTSVIFRPSVSLFVRMDVASAGLTIVQVAPAPGLLGGS